MNAIKLLAETDNTVTISRADLETLVQAAEDAEDTAAVRMRRRHEESLGGYEMAKGNYLTGDEAKRILAGDSPVRIWREKRGLTQRALAQASGIQAGYLNEIENGKKPGSLAAHTALAGALGVALDDLA
jgi:DNA-binding XRE family transcriptional regulator